MSTCQETVIQRTKTNTLYKTEKRSYMHLRKLVPHFFDLLSFLANDGTVKLLLYDQILLAFIFLECHICQRWNYARTKDF